MASDKDRADIISDWETVIDWGDQWNYFIGNQAPPNNWNQLGFSQQAGALGQVGLVMEMEMITRLYPQ